MSDFRTIDLLFVIAVDSSSRRHLPSYYEVILYGSSFIGDSQSEGHVLTEKFSFALGRILGVSPIL